MQFFLSAELIQNLFSSALLYFVPNKVAGRIPLPVRGQSTVMSIFCMPVCKRISRTTNPIFTNFVHFTYCRGTILLWWQYDTLCTSGFMDDVMFVHKRQEWATQKKRRLNKGQHRLDTAAYTPLIHQRKSLIFYVCIVFTEKVWSESLTQCTECKSPICKKCMDS